MSQAAQILNYMLEGKAITPIEALKLFGCFRLGARIHDLREAGYQIETRLVKSETSGSTFASYFIEEAEIRRIKNERASLTSGIVML